VARVERSPEADAVFSKLAQIILPILATGLISIFVFLLVQNLKLKDEISNVKLEELQRYGEIRGDMALLDMKLTNIENKVDKILQNNVGVAKK
jgi:hypothetical protein